MKKYLSLLFAVAFIFTLCGCGCSKDGGSTSSGSTSGDDTKTQKDTLNHLYSDDSKLVYKNGDMYKMVYYYEGNTITKVETYYEYATEEEAKTQYQAAKDTIEYNESISDVSNIGKYVIYTWDQTQYADLTVDQIVAENAYLEEVTK